MTAGKAILIGCGTALVALVLIAAGVIGWLVYTVQDPEGLAVTLDSPLDVKTGETFPLVVHVRNDRPRKPLTVTDIDIGEDYLEGFVVVATEPAPLSSMHILDNTLSHTFNATLAPGASTSFVFRLRAEREGRFRGEIDVCEGSRFLSVATRTVVREK